MACPNTAEGIRTTYHIRTLPSHRSHRWIQAQCAIRECHEETGITAEVTGFLGIYSDPLHIVEYTDGEVRQEFEITLIGRPLAGKPIENDEASEVAWFQPSELDQLDIHPTMRRQLNHYLAKDYPHID